MKKYLVFVMVFFLAVCLSGCGSTPSPKEKEPKKATSGNKDSIPDFTVKNLLDDKEITISSLKGKVVIIDFWATWCPPCRKEIPHFIELYNEYPREKLEIIGISTEMGGEDKVKAFIQENKINYPTAIITEDIRSKFKDIRSIPTTFVVDPEGRVVEKFIGYREKSVFENEIKKYIK